MSRLSARDYQDAELSFYHGVYDRELLDKVAAENEEIQLTDFRFMWSYGVSPPETTPESGLSRVTTEDEDKAEAAKEKATLGLWELKLTREQDAWKMYKHKKERVQQQELGQAA